MSAALRPLLLRCDVVAPACARPALVVALRGHLASASADLTDPRPRSGESLVRAAARVRRLTVLVAAAEAAL